MELYPRYLYHKELAPDGKMVQSIEDEQALGDGWVPTPAMFDPKYVAPPELVPAGSIPADAAAQGYVPQMYPAIRYRADGETCIVQNADEDAALDGTVWLASPATFAKPAAATPAALRLVPPTDEPAVLASGDDAAAEDAAKQAAAELAAKARELHATSVAEVQKALEGCPDKAFLQRVKDMEMLNPEGPRVTLVRAIDGQMKALDAPTAAPTA